METYALYPSSINLSESRYFPPIGNQGLLNSCVAWATTYYQFSYEMNKLNNRTATANNSYSPSWTWNFLNEGKNIGTWYKDAYKVLELFGAESLSEMNYNMNNYNYSWSTNESAQINALSQRVNNVCSVGIGGSNNDTCITSNTDSDLNSVKQLLNAGHVLTVMTNSWTNVDNDYTIYRGNDTSSGWHALTIVGYDDNSTYDINGNGIIETFEKGAFIAANSWGTSSGQNGFCRIMYDALNTVSASPSSDWEANEPGNRKAIFNQNPEPSVYVDGNLNIFYYIEVEKRNVNFIGRLDFSTNYRNKINVSIQHRNNYGADNYTQMYPIRNRGYADSTLSYSGSMFLDYGNCYNGDNPYNYYNNHNWYIKFGSTVSSWLNNPSYRIIDNKSSTIAQFNTISLSSGTLTLTENKAISLLLGDLDYSGAVGLTDLARIQQYLSGNTFFSNVQKRLADCNSDGVIDDADKNYISSATVN